MNIIYIILFVLIASNASAESVFHKHFRGKYFFEETIDDENELQKQAYKQNLLNTDYSKFDTYALKDYENKLFKAFIADPIDDNLDLLKKSLEIKKMILVRMDAIPEGVSKLLRENPELAFNEIQTTSMGLQASSEQKWKENEQLILENRDKLSLIVFYKSDCTYSQKFAPVIKIFAENYGINLKPISVDNKPLPEFPKFTNDAGYAESMGVTSYPRTFLYSSEKDAAYPIADGLVTFTTLFSAVATVIKSEIKI